MPRFRVFVQAGSAGRSNPRALYELLSLITPRAPEARNILYKLVREIIVKVYGYARRRGAYPDFINIYLGRGEVDTLARLGPRIIQLLHNIIIDFEYIIDGARYARMKHTYRKLHAAYLLHDIIKQILAQAECFYTCSTQATRAG